MADATVNNSYILGGGNLAVFRTITPAIPADPGAQPPVLAEDAVPGDIVWLTSYVEESKPTKNDDGSYSFALTILNDNADFQDFIDTYTVATSGGTFSTTLEDGTLISSATAGATNLTCEIYGGKTTEQTPMRKLWLGVVNISNKSGAWTQKANEATKPILEFISVANPEELDFAGLLDTTKVTEGTDDFILDAGSKGQVFYADIES
ncbi:MAG: hypothetical protein RLY43_210 [Bacteroidota bacterium]